MTTEETKTVQHVPTLAERHNAGQESRTSALAADLARYGDALLPGAAAELARRNPGIAAMPPDKRAEKVAELVESPLWAKFRNPEARPVLVENGQPAGALRQALLRHEAELAPGAVDQLVEPLVRRAGEQETRPTGRGGRPSAGRVRQLSVSEESPAPARAPATPLRFHGRALPRDDGVQRGLRPGAGQGAGPDGQVDHRRRQADRLRAPPPGRSEPLLAESAPAR